jgi:4-hydroxy-3-methylbut-2-enyl diphosphate reductase
LKYPEGRYLVVRDMDETDLLCAFIRGEIDAAVILETFAGRVSEGFDPHRDLARVGVANQTTMLASESLAIAARLGEAMADRHGAEELPARFRSFDTICSATQDRQDAVKDLMEDPPDVMIVIGGFNSSNTNHLAALCAESTRTYHIESAGGIDGETGIITHKRAGTQEVHSEQGWMPGGPVEVGLTAGASTPDSLIGETAESILRMDAVDPEQIEVALAAAMA